MSIYESRFEFLHFAERYKLLGAKYSILIHFIELKQCHGLTIYPNKFLKISVSCSPTGELQVNFCSYVYIRIFKFQILNTAGLQFLAVIFYEVSPLFSPNCHFHQYHLIENLMEDVYRILYTHTHTHTHTPTHTHTST